MVLHMGKIGENKGKMKIAEIRGRKGKIGENKGKKGKIAENKEDR